MSNSIYDRMLQKVDLMFKKRDKVSVWSLPSKSVTIMTVMVDALFLIAEYRVFDVGYRVTDSRILALGFVAVSSIPFYLGQVTYYYNKANDQQLWISRIMIGMGLLVSAFYGFAELLMVNTYVITEEVTASISVESLFAVAVLGTVLLIVLGLAFILLDDGVSKKRESEKLKGEFEAEKEELEQYSQLLGMMELMKKRESELRGQFPGTYDLLRDRLDKNKSEAPENEERIYDLRKRLLAKVSADLKLPVDEIRWFVANRDNPQSISFVRRGKDKTPLLTINSKHPDWSGWMKVLGHE